MKTTAIALRKIADELYERSKVGKDDEGRNMVDQHLEKAAMKIASAAYELDLHERTQADARR